jgi:glycosyltransferase involved in cell wall biosynthesis
MNNEEKLKISVVTVCYNAAATLEQTMLSVLNQSYDDVEYIIIDGNSKDCTVDIIKKYADRLAYWVSESDKGIYDAMNKGIKVANGDYIVFMNAGDCFCHNHSIEYSIPYLQQKKDVISGTAHLSGQIWYAPDEEELSLTFFIKKSLNHQATFIKRSLFENELYRTDLRIVSDSIFFFKKLILENASYMRIPVEVATCEDSGASGNMIASFKELIYAIKKLVPKRMAKDVDFIIVYYNPAVLIVGKWLYKAKWLKSVLRLIRSKRKVR